MSLPATIKRLRLIWKRRLNRLGKLLAGKG